MEPKQRESIILDYVRANPNVERERAWAVVHHQIQEAIKEERERCAEIAEEEDNGDLGGRIAERIAAKIREAQKTGMGGQE